MNAFIKNISLAYAREFLGTVSSQIGKQYNCVRASDISETPA